MLRFRVVLFAPGNVSWPAALPVPRNPLTFTSAKLDGRKKTPTKQQKKYNPRNAISGLVLGLYCASTVTLNVTGFWTCLKKLCKQLLQLREQDSPIQISSCSSASGISSGANSL